MKRYTLLLICLLALVGAVRAQDNGDTWFNQANAAYNAGNYDTAVVLYEKILTLDVESVPLYYNMGNAYYKKHDYAMAIYCYEKALKLDPSNDDVKTNLAIANLAIVDKIEPVPQSFFVKGWRTLRTACSGNQWAWISIASFTLILVALFLFLRSRRVGLRKLGFFMGLLLLVVFVFSVIFAAMQKREALVQNQAIVMEPTVTVKSSPGKVAVDLFVLHEGSKVDVLETVKVESSGNELVDDSASASSDWSKIRIASGSIGWLPTASIRVF